MTRKGLTKQDRRSLRSPLVRTAAAVEALPTATAIAAAFDTAIRASALAVSGAVTVSGSVTPTGALTETTFLARHAHSTRSDSYTGAANGTAIALTYPCAAFAILVKGTGGTPTIWDIRLEGSLDGTNYQQILAHTNATGDGVTLFSGATLSPCLWIRSRSAGAITLGTASAVAATILGIPIT